MAIRTIGTALVEARTLLQDEVQNFTSVQQGGGLPIVRYSDAELLDAFNGAMAEARTKRPDLFLAIGLRTPLPYYTVADINLPFPLDLGTYNAFVYYVVGRTELREDTFAVDGRATVLMNKFVAQLLQASS